ncbi:MAG: group II intron maturase-specific domain-containing protein [Bacteroidota bacterium]
MTSRRWSVWMDFRLARLNSLIQGWVGYFGLAKVGGRLKRLDEWVGYFGLAKAGGRLKRLDEWVGRRLRMCIWKQWKRVRTRLKALVRLGIPWDQAYEWANTRKG